MKNECYYCGCKLDKGSWTREHIPPKQIFKGFKCDSFTVPSCPAHNTIKTGDDETIVKGLLKSLDLAKNTISLNKDVEKAISLAGEHFDQVKKSVSEISLINDIESAKYQIAFINELETLPDWIVKLSAGILWTATKTYDPDIPYQKGKFINSTGYNCDASGLSVQEYLKQNIEKKELISMLHGLNWLPGWKSGKKNYPETLYCFSITFLDDYLIVRHRFYEQYTFYCLYQLEKHIVKKMYNCISRISSK